MSPYCGQWKCRICGFERYHQVSVPRKTGPRDKTSFYARSLYSVMFLNPCAVVIEQLITREHRGAPVRGHVDAATVLESSDCCLKIDMESNT
jgi:hypothetical protein